MRLSMISRIIQTEVNPIIVLFCIQNRDRYKKTFAVKRLVQLTFQTAAGHFCCFEIFAALRWLYHQRPMISFLDSSGNDVMTSEHRELTRECRPIRYKHKV